MCLGFQDLHVLLCCLVAQVGRGHGVLTCVRTEAVDPRGRELALRWRLPTALSAFLAHMEKPGAVV